MVRLKKAKPSVKSVFRKLDRLEPWSNSERKGLSTKEQNLIRGIQLRDKTDKKTAKETYVNYLNKGSRQVKSLSTSVRKYLKSKYPRQGKMQPSVEDLELPKSKTKIRKENKKQVKTFISNKKNKFRNETTYTRVQKASQKYPNASLGELRHGVNSQWSQDYRVRHGLSRNYK